MSRSWPSFSFGLGLDSDSSSPGLGLVLDSTKVVLTTALAPTHWQAPTLTPYRHLPALTRSQGRHHSPAELSVHWSWTGYGSSATGSPGHSTFSAHWMCNVELRGMCSHSTKMHHGASQEVTPVAIKLLHFSLIVSENLLSLWAHNSSLI